MSWLRDFWFPLFLAIGGSVVSVIGLYVEGNARRVAWSVAIVVYALAALSYVWGDPVRGPFARLTQPHPRDMFYLHAGISMGFPIAQLKDGIDFSKAFQMPGNPVVLRVSRRWLSGMRYSVALSNGIRITNDTVESLPQGWDVNSDDNAVEIVNQQKIPMFQVIQSGNYDVYINMVLSSSPDGSRVTIMNGNKLLLDWPMSRVGLADYPPTIFKYPSYIHRHQR